LANVFSGFTEKLPDPMNAFPALFAAAVAEAFDGFENRFRFVTDEIVVDVDDQHRGSLAEAGSFAVTGKSEDLSIALSQNIIPSRHPFVSFALLVLEPRNIAKVIIVVVPKPSDDD
jgi:hypothetical protein